VRSRCLSGIKQRHAVGRCRLRCNLNVNFCNGCVTFNLVLISKKQSSRVLVQVRYVRAANLSTKSTVLSPCVRQYLLLGIFTGYP
jgi:hypothetical protein